MSFSLSNLTKSKIKSLPFSRIARLILGGKFDLSVVVCGETLSRSLNRRRGKRSPTNILSFKLLPVGGSEVGEIFLNGVRIRREARLLGKAIRRHFLDLYLHGLFHLKGLRHGRKMDQAVHKFAERFDVRGV